MTGNEHRAGVARLLAQVAADLDRRGLHHAGIVRQGARLLLEPPGGSDNPGGCAGCGAPLKHPATGRKRKWCGDRCRDRARRRSLP